MSSSIRTHLGMTTLALLLLAGFYLLLRLTPLPVASPTRGSYPGGTTVLSATVPVTVSVTLTTHEPFTPTLYLPILFESAYLYAPWVSFADPWFSQPQPYPGATEQSPNVNLVWVDERRGEPPIRYEIHLQAEVAEAVVWVGQSDQPHIDPPTLALATTYRWQVVALDGQGQRRTGPLWHFTTEGIFTPDKVAATVRIPAGEFQMGCDQGNPQLPKQCWPREQPLHTVYLDAYEIDKYEVTNQRYRACVVADACAAPQFFRSRKRNHYFENEAYAHYPVLFVSWWNAQDYCRWQGKRLPTEAEWEKAARGQIDTRAWPWGHEYPDCTRLNYTDNSGTLWKVCVDDTTQVGSYPAGASPYGVMDMAGNVFEWVADIFSDDYYKEAPYRNPTGPDGSGLDTFRRNLFVIRGGSYRPHWFYPQVNHRHWGHHGVTARQDAPFYRNDQVGFRCARTVEE